MLLRYLPLILATFFWGGTFIAGKFSIRELPAMEIAFIRFALASLCFYPFLKKTKLLHKNTLSIHINYFVIGALAIFGYHYLFFESLNFTSAISAALIVALNPIMTMILSAIFFNNEKLSIKKVTGTFISLFGVIFVITEGNFSTLTSHAINPGDMMMLGAVLCWALSIIVSKRLMKRKTNITQLTFYSTLYGTLIYVPFLWRDGFFSRLPQASLLSWGSIIYMTLFSTVVAYIFYYDAIKKIGASQTALMLNLVPVFAGILAIIILNEILTAPKAIGGFFVFIGIYLVLRKKEFIDANIKNQLRYKHDIHKI